MTQEQSEQFSILNAQLDDPSYYRTLNLAEFSESQSLLRLPKAVQLLLLDKLLTRFNQGLIERDRFLAMPAP
jgi:hypothetical protein